MDLSTSFNILGLDSQADPAQAKKAYKAQVRRWHPDQFPEGSTHKAQAEERLKLINIAYARVRQHLSRSGSRPDPAVAAGGGSGHASSKPNAADPSMPEGNGSKRTWMDHLFDTLNNFCGGADDEPPPGPSAENRPSRCRSFKQVLDEMGGRADTTARDPVDAPPKSVHRRPVAAYRRRGGTGVDAINGTPRVEPVKPVGRIRGIGKDR